MSTSKRLDDGLPLAERGQAFLQSARALRGLSSERIERIARRLDAPPPRGQRRILLRASAATALLLTASAAAAWAGGALDRFPGWGALFGREERDRPTASKAVPRSPSEPGVVAPTAGPGVGAPPVVSGSALEPTTDPGHRIPVASAATHHAPTRLAHRARRAAQPSTEPAESPIVLEGRSFAQVLELWQARRDGNAALTALDAHERRFAGGQMRTEALVLRAEILLAGRREREALAALDRVPLDNAPRGRELRTVRGELRVRFNRCEEARVDLAVVGRGADEYAARARAALVRCP
jgi:hypothetical protein